MSRPRGAFAVLIAVPLWLALAAAVAAACRDDVADLRGPWGQARFNVEIADTPETLALGLMHRQSLPRNAGMLFVYAAPQTARFWMRNTLIPLDMIFIAPDGVVSHVHHEAVPLDETVIEGGDGILLVLEINGGLARSFGIAPGSELRHPRVPQDTAAWPCN